MNAYRRGVRLSVTLAPKASTAIDRLLRTGLYGRSRAAIAQEFIYRGLRDVPVAWSGIPGKTLRTPRSR